MDIKTIIRILDIAEPQLSAQDFNTIRTIIRKEYLMNEIAVREEYLTRKVKAADITRQFQAQLPVLQAQLAAL